MDTRIQQYLHRPNKTELGLTGTHETYLSVNKKLNLIFLFPSGIEQEFIDLTTNKKYKIKSVVGKEFRVNKMGQFYRDRNVKPGDEIILQKIFNQDGSFCYIDVINFKRVLFFGSHNGYDIANIEHLPFSSGNSSCELSVMWNQQIGTLTIQFDKTDKRRTDSSDFTDYYRIFFNGQEITSQNLMLTLNEQNILSSFIKYEFHEINWEG